MKIDQHRILAYFGYDHDRAPTPLNKARYKVSFCWAWALISSSTS